MKKLLQSRIGKILGVCIVILSVVAVGIILMVTKEETYRTIEVDNFWGITIIANEEIGKKEAYQGMHLYSGDSVKVQKEANLTLCMDRDKYVYAEEKTSFKVERVENEAENKLVIHLSEGSVLNRLKNKLANGESYTIETPNATMGVRGTVFRVTVDKDENNINYTLVEVFDGMVQVDLKEENGDYNGETDILGPGESALIRGNTEFAEFVVDANGKNKGEIAYKQIPKDVAKVLVQFIDDGEELCIGKELLMDYTELTEHKMETVTGKEATCEEDGYKEVKCVVCKEVTEKIVLPATGHTLADWKIVQEPTCVKTGKQKRICDTCKTYFEEEELAALGHEEGQLVVTSEADCTNKGVKTATCTRCEEVVEEVEIPALGHSYVSTVTIEATCNQEGSETHNCSVCGHTYVSVIAVTEHQFTNTMHNAMGTSGDTCTKICGECRYRVDTPCTYTFIDEWVDEEGNTVTKEQCTNCGMYLESKVITPNLGT